jgi:hypothetical protein
VHPEPGTSSVYFWYVWHFTHRFYAGGSERSGQQIVGPPRKKSPNELVDDLFKGAKEHGAVAVERVTKSPGETSKPRVSIRVVVAKRIEFHSGEGSLLLSSRDWLLCFFTWLFVLLCRRLMCLWARSELRNLPIQIGQLSVFLYFTVIKFITEFKEGGIFCC